MSGWKVHYFPISDRDLNNFRRNFPAPEDCVINAIELLGLVSPRDAALMRILVGKRGVETYQIEDIFRWIYPDYGWRFHRIAVTHPNKNRILNHLQSIPPSSVVFAGIEWTRGGNHVILLGRQRNGELVALDPQSRRQPIIAGLDPIIQAYLSLAANIYFLESATRGDDPMEID